MNDDTFVPAAAGAGRAHRARHRRPVPEPWAQLLVDWRSKVGDPQANLVPPHVTLLPPTEVAVADRAAISAHLAEVARCHPPFEMHLSGTGTFSPVSDVVFIAVAKGIGNCELLATDVRRGPLARPLSFPYHPHVTVAHDVPADMLEFAYNGLADLSAVFPVELVHRVRADPERGVGGRPRVPADRSASLTERRRRAGRPQTRPVTSAPPRREPLFTRLYARGEALVAGCAGGSPGSTTWPGPAAATSATQGDLHGRRRHLLRLPRALPGAAAGRVDLRAVPRR